MESDLAENRGIPSVDAMDYELEMDNGGQTSVSTDKIVHHIPQNFEDANRIHTKSYTSNQGTFLSPPLDQKGNRNFSSLDTRMSTSKSEDHGKSYHEHTTLVKRGRGIAGGLKNYLFARPESSHSSEIKSSSNDEAKRGRKSGEDFEHKEHELVKRIQYLEDQAEIRRKTNSRQKEKMKSMQEQFDAKLRGLEDHITQQKIAMVHQETDMGSLSQRFAALSRDQEAMEDQVRTAQLAMSTKSSRPKGGLADEERTINGYFIDLQNEVRKWAKIWAGAEFSTIKKSSAGSEAELLRDLATVMELENGKLPAVMHAAHMTTKASVLCASALIGRYICSEILEAPFRPLRSLESTATRRDDGIDQEATESLFPSTCIDTVMKDVYRKLAALNESRAQIWRCDMMSILDPTSTDESLSQAILPAQMDAARRRAQVACDLTFELLGTSINVFLNQVEPEDVINRHEQLQSILQKAVDVAGRLWKQPTILKCLYFENLEKQRFSYDSELLTAHAFHRLGLDDEDENRLDEHPVRVVVFPAVKAYGNSEGEDYSKDRVWGKAVVWVDE